MSISKANINWTGVSHAATGITRVSACSFGWGGNLIKFKGDTDQYPTVIAMVDQEPHASVTSADIGGMMALVPGADATLLATLNDAKLVSMGGVLFTMTHAVFENCDPAATHAQFASATGTWQGYSVDGSTPPLVITRV